MPLYYQDVEHVGLNKFRRIRGNDEYVIQRKAEEQLREWERQWQRQQTIETGRKARAAIVFDRSQKKELATHQSADAQAAINEIKEILAHRASLKKANWNSLYDRSQFNDPIPKKPAYEDYPKEPSVDDPKFRPNISVFSAIFPFLKRKRVKEANELWLTAHADWEIALHEIEKRNDRKFEDYKSATEKWVEAESAFKSRQDEGNKRIDQLRERHLNGEPEAVIEFVDLMLSRSEYPAFFPKRWEIGFDGPTGVMVIDYDLPDVSQLPNIAAVRYVQSRNAFENVYLKNKELDELYEAAVYQTCLRTIVEVFASDFVGAIQSVTFNGYVDFIDPTKGKPARRASFPCRQQRPLSKT